MNYNTEENIRKCRERLDEIEHLQEGWDSYGGAVPDKLVCDNARTFFQTLVDNNCLVPHYEDIHPTPYGSIVIDVYPDAEDKDLVSMEIGRRQCGFFTDYQHGINSGSDGYDTDFRRIPYFLNEHINLDLIKMNKFLKLRKDDLEFRWSSCNGKFEIVKWFHKQDPKDEDDLKEWCIMVASFVNVNSEGECDLQWCGRRPMELNKGEFKDFLELVEFGYNEIRRMYWRSEDASSDEEPAFEVNADT